jgi:outer membrane murein-binding lipoprotein Lpp
MKKLVLFAAIVATVAFSSCTKKAEAPVEEAPVPVEEVAAPVEEVVTDTTIVEAPAETPAE